MNQEEFQDIVESNKGLIYKVSRLYCRDDHSCSDLQQEILLQLWISIGRYDGRAKLSTWIYRVALNTAISFYRKDSRRRSVHSEIDGAVFHETVDEEDSLMFKALHEAVSRLNGMNKALVLLYLEGNRNHKIAEIMGISVSNVSTRLNRLKPILKSGIEKILND